MHYKKSFPAPIAALCFTIFSVLVFIGCSGAGDTKTSDSDTATVQPATIAPADSSAMGADTTALDSASTRPVKSPN